MWISLGMGKNFGMGRSWKNFEKHKVWSALSRLLVETWTLKVLPVRPQQEMRNMLLEVKKATPELDLQNNTNHQYPNSCAEIEKLLLKLIWKFKGPITKKKVLKKQV